MLASLDLRRLAFFCCSSNLAFVIHCSVASGDSEDLYKMYVRTYFMTYILWLEHGAHFRSLLSRIRCSRLVDSRKRLRLFS